MHLVLRSTKAKGKWSFKSPHNKKNIKNIIDKFAGKYGIQILLSANVGNHLHFHIKLSNRHTYKAFIRAVTSSIAMAVTGASRWQPMKELFDGKFWDCRPFTRVVQGFRDQLNLNNYIQLNILEGCGYSRQQARFVLSREWNAKGLWP